MQDAWTDVTLAPARPLLRSIDVLMRTLATRAILLLGAIPLAGCAAGIDFNSYTNDCDEADGLFDSELSELFCSGDWGEGAQVVVFDPGPPAALTSVTPVAARFENFIAVGTAFAAFDGDISGCPNAVNYGVAVFGVNQSTLTPQLQGVFAEQTVTLNEADCARLSAPAAWVPTSVEILDVQSPDARNATKATVALGAGELGLFIATLTDGAGNEVTRIAPEDFEGGGLPSVECTEGFCVIDGETTETRCTRRVDCLGAAARDAVEITGLAALSTRSLLVGTGSNGLWRVSVEDGSITPLGGTAQAIHYRPSLQPEFDLVWVADVDPTVGVAVYRPGDLNTATAETLAPLNTAPLPESLRSGFAVTDLDSRTNRGFAIGRSFTQDGTALAQLVEFRLDDERISLATQSTVRVGFSAFPTVGFVDPDTIAVGLPADGLSNGQADSTLQLKVYDADNPGTVDSDAPIVSRNFTRIETGENAPRRGAYTSLGLIVTSDGRTLTPFDFEFVRTAE